MTTAAELIDYHDIRQLMYRYCRAIDRRQFDVVRTCYHPDATDEHGVYRGGLDGFMEMIQADLPRYERTLHFVGNHFIELDGDAAWSEAYTIAYHRLAPHRDKPQRDYVVGFRYVDRLERRDEWRIAARKCIFEWSRLDPVPVGGEFGPDFLRGVPGPDDPMLRWKQGME
jgi:3-phenylpropionate/cinnamic acid dioxygenase small subunit